MCLYVCVWEPVGWAESIGDELASIGDGGLQAVAVLTNGLAQAVAVVTVGRCSLWPCQDWVRTPLVLHWLQLQPALMISLCSAGRSRGCATVQQTSGPVVCVHSGCVALCLWKWHTSSLSFSAANVPMYYCGWCKTCSLLLGAYRQCGAGSEVLCRAIQALVYANSQTSWQVLPFPFFAG